MKLKYVKMHITHGLVNLDLGFKGCSIISDGLFIFDTVVG